MEPQKNNWIKFLRKYGSIPQNDNMYDEVQWASRSSKYLPISFEAPYLHNLIENFNSDSPSSVILTGTAGDGKTFLCRKIWEHLGGSTTEWNSDKKERLIPLNDNSQLVIVKDLSEFQDKEKSELIKEISLSLNNGLSSKKVFLIAANDGQLMEAFNKTEALSSVGNVRDSLEEALVTGQNECKPFSLLLFNLSLFKSSELFPRILEAFCNHDGWLECEECSYSNTDSKSPCPISENLQRLKEPLFTKRLKSLLILCDCNGQHIPIRHLLLLLSNGLLGHPDVKDQLMICSDIPKLLLNDNGWKGNIYTNVFGGNLKRRRKLPEIFDVLCGFGIGEETSNKIDHLLIFGPDDPAEKDNIDIFFGNDVHYGLSSQFEKLRKAYLEGESSEKDQEFLDALVGQRQRLFFIIPDDRSKELGLWKLSVFQYSGEYLDEVVDYLKIKKQPPRRILSRLVKGINRIFTGMLTNTDDEIWLATTGSNSQARVSRLLEGRISVMPDRGQSVKLEIGKNGTPEIIVNLDRNKKSSLLLNIVRYEYLSRVAQGVLPSSFSRECYEDILSFKSLLLANFLKLHKEDSDSGFENEIMLRLLSLDDNNRLTERQIAFNIEGGIL